MQTWQNWSGLVECQPNRYLAPESVEELREAVASARQLRVAGSGHSFTSLVPCDDVLVSLHNLSGVVSIDRDARRARCYAGTKIRDVGQPLFLGGLALANQGDIDRQALAGALSTATHGTGEELGCIASRVTGLTLIDAAGELVRASADESSDLFAAARVGLGVLGVLIDIELACESAYCLRERTWSEATDDLIERWESLATDHRHFEFFAFPFTGMSAAKSLTRVSYSEDHVSDEEPGGDDTSDEGFRRLLDLNLADPRMARAKLAAGLERTPDVERVGPAYRIFPSERNNRFNEMEFAVPREEGAACLRAVLEAIEQADVPVLFPIEFRTVAADDIWLSPFYERDSVTLSVHQDARQDHREVFDLVEPILIRHGGRPHWGKIHSLQASELARLYPRWRDFGEVRRSCDPEGKFLNPHVRAVLEASE